jgi:hypothetical protein
LKKYPDGEFADLAKNRLKKIEVEQPKPRTSENTEPEYWETIRNSKDAQDFKDYLQAYPNGVHAAIAGLKIKQLEAAKTTTPANTSTTNSSSSNLPRTRTNQAGIEFVLIPPGSFMMGSTNGGPDEKPVHQVRINYSFGLSRLRGLNSMSSSRRANVRTGSAILASVTGVMFTAANILFNSKPAPVNSGM